MRKNKIWIITACILLIIAALIFWLIPQNNSNPEQNSLLETANGAEQAINVNGSANTLPFASKSQQDTEINCQMMLDHNQRLIVNEATRNCFEYFITQYGEKKLQQIQDDFKRYITQSYHEPTLSQILDLWQRYLEYRQALGDLAAPAGIDQESPEYYRSIYTSTQNLRKKFFSAAEIQGLFGAEDTYHEYTLNRMSILADKSLSPTDKAQKLKELFEQLPKDWQENLEQLNKVDDLRKLTSEIKARNGSESEIRQMRLNLVGPEATQRLEHLDTERHSWKSAVTDYLAARDTILSSGMSDSAKQQAVLQLRQQHFKQSEERLRVETFEQIHDQGGKLPFPD